DLNQGGVPDLSLENDFVGLREPVPDGVREALDLVRKRLKVDPNDLITQVSRVALLDQYGPPAKAVALYRQLQARWPGPGTLWVWQPIHRLLDQQRMNPASIPGYVSEPKGHTYAFIVGISKYLRIDPLRFAEQDAELFKRFLMTDRG